MTWSPSSGRWRAGAVAWHLVLAGVACGQLRIATWNVSNYSGDSGRDAAVQTAVYDAYEGRSFSPDVILGQEFLSSTAATHFRDLLNSATGSPGDWAAQFVNGPNEGSVMFYRTSRCEYRGYAIISYGGTSPEPPRNTVRFKIRPVGYVANAASLYLYNSHMKAGDTADDQARRLVEAQRIRDNAEALASDSNFLLCGDYNIAASTESAYQELVGSQANNAGRFFDPVVSPGTWRDTYAYRFIHSQDPATASGMDDRYDQILFGLNLRDGVGFDYLGNPAVPFSTTTWNDPNHSYRSWGNDGTSFNQPLRTTGNTMVGATIAQALKDCATASGGHLPVYLELRVPAKVGSDAVLDFGPVPQGLPAEVELNVWNSGDEDEWTASGIADLHYELAASAGFTAPPGPFTEPAGDQGNTHTIVMDTTTMGPKSGTLTITSDDPDVPVRTVTLMGEVTGPVWCLGDMNCSGGAPTFDDIKYFAVAMSGEAAWLQYYRDQNGGADPPCPWLLGDYTVPRNGVEFSDIKPFAAGIGGACEAFVP